MGTKMGGLEYGDYEPFGQQSSLYEEKRKMSSKEFENQAEILATNKLNNVQPDWAEMRNLNHYAEEVQNDIGEKLSIKEKHLFGSSVKNTMVDSSHKKDADILVVLDSEKHADLLSRKDGAQVSLVKVKEALERNPKYNDAEIKIDGNAVVVRQSGKTVDVVPAFRNPNGSGFLIPENRNGSRWIRTDPRTSKRILNIEDKKHYGQVRPMVQLAKDWNERNGKKLKSYHMEAMVIQHFMNKDPRGERSLHANADEFFYRLPEYVSSSQMRDPATDEKLGDYLSSNDKEKVIKSAMKTRENIEKARSAKEAGDGDKSLYYYRRALYKGEE